MIREVVIEDQRIISDLMFEYAKNFQDSIKDKPKSKAVLDVSNLDSIDDKAFKAWFGYKKEQFLRIRQFTEKGTQNQFAVLLCKIRTALSNELLSYLFGFYERIIENYLNAA